MYTLPCDWPGCTDPKCQGPAGTGNGSKGGK